MYTIVVKFTHKLLKSRNKRSCWKKSGHVGPIISLDFKNSYKFNKLILSQCRIQNKTSQIEEFFLANKKEINGDKTKQDHRK